MKILHSALKPASGQLFFFRRIVEGLLRENKEQHS
jgi:hypothetical protein